jgi:hypothetical protein
MFDVIAKFGLDYSNKSYRHKKHKRHKVTFQDSTTIKRVHLLHHLSTIFINIFEGRPLFLGGFHLSGGTR